ncbi:type II toxin-antitoxin system VapC family toxin [candidate division KSB1 bacterium]|nr:type II toxin-antitoxin system VapC family toxin [candidate division KSB1 bacterium]MCH8954669.1 type II toxin-antitoxin system VapC family toxin [candidate division KSB1 bacterium]
MFLVDTNIWLERILDQDKSHQVQSFLQQISSNKLFITDFTYHSIGVIITNLGHGDAFDRFTQDIFIDGAVSLIRLKPEASKQLIEVIDQFKLDFDDAYQYLAAELNDLTIVSFDKDFDKTKLGRKTPSQILKQLNP